MLIDIISLDQFVFLESKAHSAYISSVLTDVFTANTKN